MSWLVACITNTLEADANAAQLIFNFVNKDDTLFDSVSDFWDEKKKSIYFNPDHMEHIDFFNQIDSQDLKRLANCGGIRGYVIFTDIDGDACGDYWVHQFKNGQYISRHGKLDALIEKTLNLNH